MVNQLWPLDRPSTSKQPVFPIFGQKFNFFFTKMWLITTEKLFLWIRDHRELLLEIANGYATRDLHPHFKYFGCGCMRNFYFMSKSDPFAAPFFLLYFTIKKWYSYTMEGIWYFISRRVKRTEVLSLIVIQNVNFLPLFFFTWLFRPRRVFPVLVKEKLFSRTIPWEKEKLPICLSYCFVSGHF